jgi:hypothetical protein
MALPRPLFLRYSPFCSYPKEIAMIAVLFEAEARPEQQMRYLQLYVRFSTSPLPDASTPPRS